MLALLLALQTLVAPLIPNPSLTPGSLAMPLVTADQVCVPGYSSSVRDVPGWVKRRVFKSYGIKPSRDYEVDHLISLELGGSNDPSNLWPQSYLTPTWNAHVKDKLEDRLHALVCSKQLTLAAAQTAIRTNWIAAYQQYVK